MATANALTSNVVIIGAGLAGLTLALTLHNHGIRSTIYEARAATASTPGALMLSPNALRILDKLGLYETLKPQGFNFETVTFKNAHEETTDEYYLGSARKYGYDALRIYRRVLLAELRAAVEKAGVEIYYETKFQRIAADDNGGVMLEFASGERVAASLIVGADGIHSRVRAHVAPAAPPRYGGLLAITYAVPRAAVKFAPTADGAPYSCPVSITAAAGTFILAPQDADGSELLAGTQKPYPEQTREGWDALSKDTEKLKSLLRGEDVGKWTPTVRSALETIPEDSLSIWPFYTLPPLDSWTSDTGRVVLLGDAAHAIPPTAGQGASQAFEDAVTFAQLLVKHYPSPFWEYPVSGRLGAGSEEAVSQTPATAWLTTTTRWRRHRQARIACVVSLTQKLNNTRLSAAERAKLPDDEVWNSGEDGDLGWLYSNRILGELDGMLYAAEVLGGLPGEEGYRRGRRGVGKEEEEGEGD